MMARWWLRPALYLSALAVVFWLVQGIAGSIASDATFAERDRQGALQVAAARAQAKRTRVIADAYADTLAAVRVRVRAQLDSARAEIPTLSLPMQRLIASCQQLEVTSGQYVVSVIQANTAVDTLIVAQDAQVAALTTEAHPRWWRRAMTKIRDAPVPFILGVVAGVVVVHVRPP
jgi:hypothetical protein